MNRLVKSIMAAALVVFIAASLPRGQAQEQPALTDEQKAKVAETQQYIKEQAASINFLYDEQIAAIRDEKITLMLPFEIGDNRKVVDASFFGWSQYIEEVLRLSGVDLRNDEEFSETFNKFRGGSLSAVQRLDLTPKLLAIGERRLADERNEIRHSLALREMQIEKERKYALEVQLPKFQNNLVENVIHTAQPKPAGTVTGIVYSKDNPATLINSQIVHKGGQIDNVRITAITPDSVEFEKAGNRWTQKTGDAPTTDWQK